MKRINFLLIITFFCTIGFSQEIPRKIFYQGKLLENGQPVNATKSITFTIGTWTETQNIEIKNGIYSVQLGAFTPIPEEIFDQENVTLKISIDGNNLAPQTDILSVPYAFKALKAKSADNVPTKLSELTNDVGFITDPNDNDNDPSNEIQTLSKNGTSITLSKGGGTVDIADNDNDPNNELQKLSLNGNNLTISNGNTVTLPSGSGSQLPIKATTNASDDDIDIEHTDQSGNVIDVKITNSNSNDDVIKATTYSQYDGAAIFGRTENYGNAILGLTSSNSRGDAIHGVVYGTGHAGYFYVNNTNNDNDAIYVKTKGTGRAAYFSGDVRISGTLTKSSGNFLIDDPLDPENKYLYHSFVESPDMMNIYNGNVILDENGEAIVKLPDYFEALNKDFRYQLTCIGGYAQIYISEKINNNQFKISGGKKGLEVSWQVTGIRNDPYAQKHRHPAEVEKPANEKGYYLNYKEYNQSYEKSIEFLHEHKESKK